MKLGGKYMIEILVKILIPVIFLASCGPEANRVPNAAMAVGETAYIMPSLSITSADPKAEKALMIKFAATGMNALPDDASIKIFTGSGGSISPINFVWGERSKLSQKSDCPDKLMSRLEADNAILICKGVKGMQDMHGVEVNLPSGKQLSASALLFETEDGDLVTANALLN